MAGPCVPADLASCHIASFHMTATPRTSENPRLRSQGKLTNLASLALSIADRLRRVTVTYPSRLLDWTSEKRLFLCWHRVTDAIGAHYIWGLSDIQALAVVCREQPVDKLVGILPTGSVGVRDKPDAVKALVQAACGHDQRGGWRGQHCP